MNSVKQILSITALAMGIALPVSSMAQAAMDHDRMDMPSPASMTDGEVRKVDPEAGKITIRHGHIKHMDMPGMTMVFTVRNKALLADVKPGDKIQFMVVSEGSKLVITDIQPAR